jgi:hypothetical protein
MAIDFATLTAEVTNLAQIESESNDDANALATAQANLIVAQTVVANAQAVATAKAAELKWHADYVGYLALGGVAKDIPAFPPDEGGG